MFARVVLPFLILEPKLQNNQKIPKCNQRAHLVQFLGFSYEHSPPVANIRHLSTEYTIPQFYLVFDDLFQTIINQGDDDSTIEAICSDIFDIHCYWCAKEQFDYSGNIFYQPPLLNNLWIDERAIMIGSKSYCGRSSVQNIGFASGIEAYQRMMIIFFQMVPQNQMMNLVLILMCVTHLQNQRYTKMSLFLVLLHQILLQRDLRLRILIQQQILLKGQLILQNNVNPIRGINVLDPCGIVVVIIN